MLSYILCFISWCLLLGLLTFTKSKASCRHFYSLLIIKVLFGVFSGLLYYEYYQAGDVLHVQRDATFLYYLSSDSFQDYLLFLFNAGDNYEGILHQIFYEGEPRTLFFVKIISVVNILNLNNFWLCSVFISVVGFCATMYGIESIAQFYKLRKTSLKIAFLLIPSIGVWTSGVMKEALVVPALLFAASVFMSKPNFLKYALGLALLYMAFVLKYYFVVPFVVLIFFSVIIQKKGFNLWLLLAGLGLSVLSLFLHPNLHFSNFYEAVLASHDLSLDRSYLINSIDFSSLQDGWYWLILYLPKAWYYGFFAPLPWQAYSELSYLQSVQSVGILVLVVWTIYRFVSLKCKINIQAILFLLYVLFMAGLLPLCSPNIGSLSRYSVIYLPILMTICIEFYYEQKSSTSS